MRRTAFILILVAAGLFACKHEENTNTDTASVSTSGTDVSATGTTSTTSTGANGGTISALNADDKAFVMKAAIGGRTEVAGGQIAASKATNPDVKTFGQRMVTDHSKANDELGQLATVK